MMKDGRYARFFMPDTLTFEAVESTTNAAFWALRVRVLSKRHPWFAERAFMTFSSSLVRLDPLRARDAMNIRQYTNDDYTSLVALWREAFPNDPGHNEPAAMLQAKLAWDQHILVAIDGDEIVGAIMMGYDGHRGWLYSVAVGASSRRQGVGSQLVTQAMAYLRALGCIKLNLQVRDTNTQVIGFYQSLGFSIEPRVSMGVLLP